MTSNRRGWYLIRLSWLCVHTVVPPEVVGVYGKFQNSTGCETTLARVALGPAVRPASPSVLRESGRTSVPA